MRNAGLEWDTITRILAARLALTPFSGPLKNREQCRNCRTGYSCTQICKSSAWSVSLEKVLEQVDKIFREELDSMEGTKIERVQKKISKRHEEKKESNERPKNLEKANEKAPQEATNQTVEHYPTATTSAYEVTPEGIWIPEGAVEPLPPAFSTPPEGAELLQCWSESRRESV